MIHRTKSLPEELRNHAHLVQRAIRWLYGSRRCRSVVSERSPGYSGEIVDALGWQRDTTSILVECKTSLGDYYCDQVKPFRRDQTLGVGEFRWYLFPPGVIDLGRHSFPEDWGLLIARPQTLKIVKGPRAQLKWNRKREMKFLLDATRERNPFE